MKEEIDTNPFKLVLCHERSKQFKRRNGICVEAPEVVF